MHHVYKHLHRYIIHTDELELRLQEVRHHDITGSFCLVFFCIRQGGGVILGDVVFKKRYLPRCSKLTPFIMLRMFLWDRWHCHYAPITVIDYHYMQDILKLVQF